MEKLLNSLSNFKIAPLERTDDNNLTPESRKRALESIRQYISNTGCLNISELSKELELSRPTVRILANEILDELRDEAEPKILAQIKWHQDIATTLGKDPEAFTEKQIKVLKFHSTMLGKITLLQRALRRSKG